MSTSTAAGSAVICPRCATENPANAKFCQRCWAFLRGRRCPHCGKQATRAGAKYCEHCSRDLDAEPTTPLPLDDASNSPPEPAVPQFERLALTDEPETPANNHPEAYTTAPTFESPRADATERDASAESVFDEVADDQPTIPFELPEAPGHPFLPPQTASRPAPPQPVAPAMSSQVRVESAATAVATAKPQPDAVRQSDTVQLPDTPHAVEAHHVEPARPIEPGPVETMRPKAAPRAQRSPGSPALTVAVVLIVFAVIGAMLALRRQQDDVANQTAVSPAQRGAASPALPAAPPSSQAGAPTQSAPAAAPSAAPAGGTIKITTTPVAAKVELDWVQVGVTSSPPLTLVDIPPGKHTVKVSKPGFQSQIREVQVTSKETVTLDLTLPGKASPTSAARRPAVAPPPPPPPPPP